MNGESDSVHGVRLTHETYGEFRMDRLLHTQIPCLRKACRKYELIWLECNDMEGFLISFVWTVVVDLPRKETIFIQ